MVIAMLGLLAISLGAILTGTEILESSIRKCWPEWAKFEQSVSYLKGSHYLPCEMKEMFLPFQEYFLEYARNTKENGHLNKPPFKKFHLTDSQIAIVDARENIRPGPNLDEMVKAFRNEKRSRVKIIGTILIIVGGILSYLDMIV
jgi:hypothetical protein